MKSKKIYLILIGLILLFIIYIFIFYDGDIQMTSDDPNPDLSDLLGELKKSEDPASVDPLAKEIRLISQKSFEMARMVVENPQERKNLKKESADLVHRLDSLAKILEDENPEGYKKVTDLISESQLDLEFVEMKSEVLSLRLAEYLKSGISDCEIQNFNENPDIIHPSKTTDKIKLTIHKFLNLLRFDQSHIDEFLSTLSDPVSKIDEVEGPYWQLQNKYARLKIVSGDPPRIITYSSRSTYHEKVKQEFDYHPDAEEEAKNITLHLASVMMPDFENRNFIFSMEHNEESYRFKWREKAAGEIISVPPNYIKVILDKESLQLKRFSMTDFHSWRTTDPQISQKLAGEIAKKEWQGKGKVKESYLWQRVRNGGKEIKTVWTVTLAFPIPEGEFVEDVVIDADTGEVIEGATY